MCQEIVSLDLSTDIVISTLSLNSNKEGLMKMYITAF